MKKGGYVYIMSNKSGSVLYTGVTNNLFRRMNEHRSRAKMDSFTYRYNVYKLVYFEFHYTIQAAITREKQIKAGSRKRNLS